MSGVVGHDLSRAVLETVAAAGVVPVVVLDEADIAGALADALSRGGIGCAEITLRTPAALDVLAAMAQVPGFTVGAGTVLTPAQARDALGAGAAFLVSPGLSADVVRVGLDAGVVVLPGVATATEVMAALSFGLTTHKFFPAENIGGAAAVRALAGPFPMIRFMPTGGIGPETADRYLALPNVLAVGGSWITPLHLLRLRDFPAIETLARDAVTSAVAARGSVTPVPSTKDHP